MENKNIVFTYLKKLTKIKFTEETSIDDLGIDSLDLVELVIDLEEKLDIKISDDALARMKKVGDILKEIKKVYK